MRPKNTFLKYLVFTLKATEARGDLTVPRGKSALTHATARHGELTLSGSGRQSQTSMSSLASLSATTPPAQTHLPQRVCPDHAPAQVTCHLCHAAAHAHLYYFPMNEQDTRREADLPPPPL